MATRNAAQRSGRTWTTRLEIWTVSGIGDLGSVNCDRRGRTGCYAAAATGAAVEVDDGLRNAAGAVDEADGVIAAGILAALAHDALMGETGVADADAQG